MPYIPSDISPGDQPDMRGMVDPLLSNIVALINKEAGDDERYRFELVENAALLFLEGLDKMFVLEDFFLQDQERDLPELQEAVSILSQTVMGTTVLKKNVRGVCNYCITRMIVLILFVEGVHYHRIDLTRLMLVAVKRNLACNRDMTSTVDCIWDEFYRRVAIPYEDIKCKENGDVYEGLV